MDTIEYRVIDKGDWARGAWDDEPDKRQWQDPATGLPCLINRGPSGALCGYVGVPDAHPLHGLSYDECWNAIEPHAHGGLTFASGCSDTGRERFNKMTAAIPARKKEASIYPRGDSANWLRDWLPSLDNFEAWQSRIQATSICHITGEGEPDNIWWFGFDCAHAGDFCPKYSARYGDKNEGYDNDPPWPAETYKTIRYVEREVARLAEQLAAAA